MPLSLIAASLTSKKVHPAPTLPVLIGSLYIVFACHLGFHYLLAVLLVLSFHSEMISNKLSTGNCCLQHPFSPVLKRSQGRSICILLDLVNLAQPHGCPPCSTGMRHPYAEAPNPVGLSGQFIQALPVFSYPNKSFFF